MGLELKFEEVILKSQDFPKELSGHAARKLAPWLADEQGCKAVGSSRGQSPIVTPLSRCRPL
jgi:hypothetical protein